jgi:branched-chain amino acid aminotransferase
MEIPYSREEIRAATLELIARNGLRTCYIRPIAYRGYGSMGLFPLTIDVDLTIAVWEWGLYLGEDGKRDGVRAKISSWRRISPETLIPYAKAGGQYLNSILAKVEAHKAGYDEALLLDHVGNVCEGTGENIFVVRDGVISTPPMTSSILEGISRDSIIKIAADMGHEIVVREIAADELPIADEVFLTGTAAEMVPVREIDDRPVGTGKPGPITKALLAVYEDALHGRDERYRDWLDPVPAIPPSS